MPGGLFRGSLIIAEANKKKQVVLATTGNGKNITAKQAKAAINKKYEDTGGIDRDKSYYHRGNNNWAEYSKARDASHSLKKPYSSAGKKKGSIAPRGSKKFDNRNSHKGDTTGRKYGKGRI